ELTYTLTFSNTGQASGNVEDFVAHVDDLTDVLDDADLVSGPIAQAPLTVSSVDTDDRFSVSGTLGAGESATVTYTVRVKPDAQRCDVRLDNFVLRPGDTTPDDCFDQNAPLCTSNPLGDITVEKSVDPADGSVVTAGQELNYTLRFTNTGQGDIDVQGL